MKTGNPNVYFEMGRRKDGFYQTAFQSAESLHGSRRERFDLVIGSGRKGQSYLYWKDGLLYQLPVSYLKAGDRWANSPGMVDGQVVFDRFISPRCLECHATLFRAELTGSKVQYSRKFLLGLSCEKCHGAASTHVAFHKANSRATAGRYILNPEQFPREQKLDQCGLCHSGAGTSIKPPFSYRPGDPLTEYLEIDPVRKDARPDVHGNQVGLLRLSRCFAASDDMSCSTCHNVHKEERDLPPARPEMRAMSWAAGVCTRQGSRFFVAGALHWVPHAQSEKQGDHDCLRYGHFCPELSKPHDCHLPTGDAKSSQPAEGGVNLEWSTAASWHVRGVAEGDGYRSVSFARPVRDPVFAVGRAQRPRRVGQRLANSSS